MHRDISLEAYLDEKFSNKIIEAVLQKALQLNINMYAYRFGDMFNTSPITIEEAMRRINDREDEAPVRCFFEDTIFYLHIIKLNDYTCTVGLGPTGFPWKKEFQRGNEIVEFDLTRYMRLLLSLIQGFKVTKIEAYIHWD